MGFSDFVFYPDYYGLVKTFLAEMPEYYRTEPVHPDGFLGEVRTYCEAKWSDLYLVVLLAITWTILRYLLTLFVLKVNMMITVDSRNLMVKSGKCHTKYREKLYRGTCRKCGFGHVTSCWYTK